jgi:hypothetical protein
VLLLPLYCDSPQLVKVQLCWLLTWHKKNLTCNDHIQACWYRFKSNYSSRRWMYKSEHRTILQLEKCVQQTSLVSVLCRCKKKPYVMFYFLLFVFGWHGKITLCDVGLCVCHVMWSRKNGVAWCGRILSIFLYGFSHKGRHFFFASMLLLLSCVICVLCQADAVNFYGGKRSSW